MKQTCFFTSYLLFLLITSCGQPKNENPHAEHAGHSNNADSVSSINVPKDTVKGSPPRMAMANVGRAHVHIEYNSPAVRNRIIWGGLVAFNEVWVTGAHEATSISFSGDVEIAGKKIKKGKYAFFTIPGKDEWTLILNKNWEQHLADEYSEQQDVLRWKVKPESNQHTERLTYRVIRDKNDGRMEMLWEKLKIQFEIKSVR